MNYDVATAIDLGRRACQEDAVATDFLMGNTYGFAVLSDGMGGHAAGDMASKIVVTEVFSELKLQTGDVAGLERDIRDILKGAVQGANACILAHASENPAVMGMGATLVAPVIFEDRLFWVSVGDSPLFLFRDGALERLNADHSMSPRIDALVQKGEMDAETARNHPDRGALTSVIMGRPIPEIDCPGKPQTLRKGDIVIAASDGLLFLQPAEIQAIVAKVRAKPSADIARALMHALDDLDDPEQDNVSVVVVQLR